MTRGRTVTSSLGTGKRDIFAHIRAYMRAMLDWRLWALVGVCFALLLLFAQLPFAYRFNVGQERGYNSDQPFLSNFNPPEGVTSDSLESWRWTKDTSTILVPGVGQRDVVVGLHIISHKSQQDPQAPPTMLNVQVGEGLNVPITLRRERALYQIYVPRQELGDGVLRVTLATEPWRQAGDRRELGVAVGEHVAITGTRSGEFVLPDPPLIVGWPLGVGLLWLALRVIGFASRSAFVSLLPLAVGVPLLLLNEAPRLGFGGVWAVQVGLSALVCAGVCVLVMPPLLARHGALPHARVLRWLLLLVVLSFVLKATARLYPESMPGDIGLHINRFQMTNTGTIYIAAQHRGLPFPFPNGLYLALAPLTLTGISMWFWFPFTAGVFEASTVLLLYLLLWRVTGRARLGLLAAAIYAGTAGGFMTTWFSFQTHVAAQWCFIALMLVLVLRWPRYDDWWTWSLIVFFLSHIYLGHIGLFINTALLGALVVLALWTTDDRRLTTDNRQKALIPSPPHPLTPSPPHTLLTAGLAATLFAALFYYSAFAWLIIAEVAGVATEGLNSATGKQPIPRMVSLRALWEGGMITHFGFFPVLLAGAGALLLGSMGKLKGSLPSKRTFSWKDFSPNRPSSILPALILASFAVSVSQAALPFITLSSITTRWLMFSAWAIAVAGALGFDALWQRGRGGQIIVAAMAGYVGWMTWTVWIEALAYRRPPIEPF